MKANKYQRRVRSAAQRALSSGKDFLLVSPMGSGKTAMLGWMADDELLRIKQKEGRSGKILILTHRKKLFKQIAGNKKDKTDLGDVEIASGRSVGTISDESLGGYNENHDIVVGMIETVHRRLLEDPNAFSEYDAIYIDEAHHAAADLDDSENIKGSYGFVIDAFSKRNPDLRLVGGTATPFRTSNEETLHPRLENAVKHIVLYKEVEEEGRIVSPNTIISDMVHKNGKTIKEMAEELYNLGGQERLARDIGPLLKEQRPDNFFDKVAREWLRLAAGKKTICFTDNVEEVDLLAEAFERLKKRFPNKFRGVGKVAARYAKYNDYYFDEYAKPDGEIDVLISCKMIGEGYNVPDTDAVVSTNRNAPRGYHAQLIGRGMRQNKDGTSVASTFLEFGASSYVHGCLEHQIAFQDIEIDLDRRGDVLSQMSIFARSWKFLGEESKYNWWVLPSDRNTFFALESPKGDFEVFCREVFNSRKNGKDSGKTINKLGSPTGKNIWSMQEVSDLTKEEMSRTWGWQASQRSETLSDDVNKWQKRAIEDFSYNKSILDLYTAHKKAFKSSSVVESESEKKRRELIEGCVKDAIYGNSGQGNRFGQYLIDIVAKNKTNNKAFKEYMRLCASAFDVLAKEGILDEVPQATLSGISRHINHSLSEGKPLKKRDYRLLIGSISDVAKTTSLSLPDSASSVLEKITESSQVVLKYIDEYKDKSKTKSVKEIA